MLITIGFIMKTMPQINVMSVGFAIKIVAGTVMLMMSLFAINEVIGGHMEWGIGRATGWARGLVTG
jgi:flagellar biosynthesis protein FliR